MKDTLPIAQIDPVRVMRAATAMRQIQGDSVDICTMHGAETFVRYYEAVPLADDPATHAEIARVMGKSTDA